MAIILGCFLFFSVKCWAIEGQFSTSKELLNVTWDRPDLRVKYLRQYPQFWFTNPKNKLSLSQALYKIGSYRESLFLGQQLLLNNLTFWDRGKNYQTIAQNYQTLKLPTKARYYYKKLITRKNQYYFYLYAQFEEYENNYMLSLNLYQEALKFSYKDYIFRAYERALYKSLIYYKFRNRDLYYKLRDILKKDPRFRQVKMRVIDKGFIF